MESTALTAPPERLERIVLLLIPPAARESVAGDLCETYCSPRQYAGEALRTVPFVIFSQLRRNLNLPMLLLQAFLIWLCLGQMVALAAMPAMLVAQAFQPVARPTPRRAMREAVLVAFATLILLQTAWGHAKGDWALSTDGIRLGLALFFVGPCLSPLLCLLRTGLIMDSDRRFGRPRTELSTRDLEKDHRERLQRLRLSRLMEASGLALAAIMIFHFLGAGLGGALLAVFFLLAGLGLLLDSPAMAQGDFLSLRARWQRDLLRDQKLRSFLSWLWFAPLLLVMHQQIEARPMGGFAMALTLSGVGVIVLCFFVAAFNRENRGRTQEQIRLLDRIREKLA